jgi:diguanylate cyclase (GGDEF)-like protein
VLKALVNTLEQELRRIDMLGRLGGEEFAVMLPATDCAGALEVAERLRKQVECTAVAWPTAQPDGLIHITISLGVALLTPNDLDATAVLKAADTALYEAKHSGRNRVVLATEQAAPSSPPT